MKINMRKGFTMIELVFVIVIIGILSAVAIPKFLETVHQAHDTSVVTFVGTLNRSVAATIWNKSISAGKNGKIVDYCGILANYINMPEELTYNNDCTFTHKTNSGASLDVKFSDGTAVSAPKWRVK